VNSFDWMNVKVRENKPSFGQLASSGLSGSDRKVHGGRMNEEQVKVVDQSE